MTRAGVPWIIPTGGPRLASYCHTTMSKSEYKASTVEITVIDGVEVDIEVRGDEDRAEKALMDLKNRLGWIAEGYKQEVPPDRLDERSDENTPIMSVDWDGVFDYETDD